MQTEPLVSGVKARWRTHEMIMSIKINRMDGMEAPSHSLPLQKKKTKVNSVIENFE